MGQIRLIVALVMSVLFGIAILSFSSHYMSDNNSVVNLDPRFNTLNGQFNESITGFYSESGNSSSGIYTATITEGDTTTRTGGSFKIGFTSLYESIKNMFGLVRYQIFGDDPSFAIFLTAISSLLTLMIGLYIWKTWQGGSPD